MRFDVNKKYDTEIVSQYLLKSFYNLQPVAKLLMAAGDSGSTF